MPKAIDFDFSQITFNSDSMQVLSLSHADKNFVLPLPITQGPINFSVLRSDGLISNRWGVGMNGKGDAYVYCRDNPNAEKVSLHASGRQHISITGETAKRIGAASRFGNVWNEPEFHSAATATFSLVFPPWGIGLNLSQALLNPRKKELLIVGHKEKLVVVSFFIVDAGSNMRGRIPHFVLGRLPIRERKTLHVIAWKEPQNGLIDLIRGTFPHMSRTLFEQGLGEDDYTMCFQGYRGSNSAYMVVVPVHYTPAPA